MSIFKKIFFYLFMICLIVFNNSNIFSMTMEEFVNDSRFCDGVLWGKDNHARNEIQSKYGGEGCFAYCQEFVYECWGHEYNRPQLGISYSPSEYKNEVCAGDVIHKRWGNGEYEQHWFAVLERNGNKLRIAESNYEYNCPPRVRVGWVNQDFYLGNKDWIVDCYHAPKFADKLTDYDDIIVDEVNMEYEDNSQQNKKIEPTNNIEKRDSYVPSNNNDNFWSEWQDEAISSSDTIEVETRQVPSLYKMIVFVCTDYDSPSKRSYYASRQEILRAQWDAQWTPGEFESAQKLPKGTYWNYANNVAGYIRSGDAYAIDYMPYYIDKIEYKTQYRYRNKENSKIETIQKQTSKKEEKKPIENKQSSKDNIQQQVVQHEEKNEIETTQYIAPKTKNNKKEKKEKKKSKGKYMNGGAKIWTGSSDNQNQTSENKINSITERDNFIIMDEVVNGENVKTIIPNMIDTSLESTQNNKNLFSESNFIKKIEAVNIANSYVGQYISFDSTEGFACVDIAKKYFYDVSGFENVAIGVEGARNYARYDYIIPSGWSRLYYPNYIPQIGDVAVWDNNWNHVAIVVGEIDNEGKITVVDQDSILQRATELNKYIVSNVTCFLVPPFNQSSTEQIDYIFNENINTNNSLNKNSNDSKNNNNNSIIDLTSLFNGRLVKIFSMETNHYISDEEGTIHADGEGGEGVFIAQCTADGWVGFKRVNGNWLSVQDQGYVRAEGANLSSWECFKVYQYKDNMYLLSQKENKYVQVINDGIQITNPLQAARKIEDGLEGATWERFAIVFVDGK